MELSLHDSTAHAGRFVFQYNQRKSERPPGSEVAGKNWTGTKEIKLL